MHITILYATYSNSTYTAAEILGQELKKLGHEVTTSLVNSATHQTLVDTNLVIFASPSWDYDGKEGQPHEDFFGFFERVQRDTPQSDFQYAIMALGDSNYTYFCGAAEEIATMANALSGKPVLEPLKLDQFYLNESTCVAAIQAWASKLSAAATAQ